MQTVRNVALLDRTGQAWPLSPKLSLPVAAESGASGGEVLLVPASAIPAGLDPADVVAASADRPNLQPPRPIENVERREPAGGEGERWALRLGER